jgi:hypothetical protein
MRHLGEETGRLATSVSVNAPDLSSGTVLPTQVTVAACLAVSDPLVAHH